MQTRKARSRERRAGRSIPLLLVPPAAVGYAFLLLPALGILIRAPWHNLRAIYARSDVGDALRLSLVTALEATVLCIVFGIPLAWLFARLRIPGIAVLRAVVTLPLVLPPVVGGIALFLAFGRNGYIGRYLNSWFGLDLPFTTHGVVLAETFVAMPFLIVSAEGAFRGANRGLEEAAATLGATRLTIFARVTVPSVAPSLAAGVVLCWARALGEFGATITFGGNLPGTTQTMPTPIYTAFQNEPQDAVALSLVLMLVAVIVLGALRDRWLRPVSAS